MITVSVSALTFVTYSSSAISCYLHYIVTLAQFAMLSLSGSSFQPHSYFHFEFSIKFFSINSSSFKVLSMSTTSFAHSGSTLPSAPLDDKFTVFCDYYFRFTGSIPTIIAHSVILRVISISFS